MKESYSVVRPFDCIIYWMTSLLYPARPTQEVDHRFEHCIHVKGRCIVLASTHPPRVLLAPSQF